MNKEEIARLMNDTAGQSFGTESHFQRFAALVAAAEREQCAQICEQSAAKYGVSDDVFAAQIRARGEE